MCPNKKLSAAIAEDVSFLTTDDFSFQAENSAKRDKWCLDSGSTSHLCYNKFCFEQIIKSDNVKVNLASDAYTEVKGKGSVKILGTNGKENRSIHLENTLHVPSLRSNLISVSKIADTGNSVTFTKAIKHQIRNSSCP